MAENGAEDGPAEPSFHSHTCLSYIIAQHLYYAEQPQACQMS